MERGNLGFDSRYKKRNTRYVKSPKRHSKRASGNKGVVKEKMTDLVVGLGEIGKPIFELLQNRGFDVEGFDL